MISHKKSLTEICKAYVPKVGLEPTLPEERDFESRASTNSATLASFEGFKDKAYLL